ncbi:ATP-binding protein [Rhizobium sp. SL86]|uniref:ATP-binding protein n=1 Tax=Rhizobium sp. SL86 TaxID=2995148 RepID=UPI00227430D5|nr:AAA family ATPase [Rhizobium sp. SL86]MCY1666488.1 AAA family ATPase [Rhizobium sp. SL86]
MRLRRLDLTRYGKFTDHAIDFGPEVAGSPDLHIVYGLNEAGKSTAFSAYLDLLFGIPERSAYNFLHAYNAMQIGGVLEFGGETHELVRLKQRANALLDGRGQPVNEALLASALGGLSRGSYRTMFSLDEHSLRDGGEAIVESKGDLGELLFSASAGLADVSTVLTAASEEAQRFHRKRARNTQLAELKQQLAALKAERDTIDTFAATYASLVATEAQAQKAYEEALSEGARAKGRFARIDAQLRALPLLKDLERLSGELLALQDLPRPPREWSAQLDALMRDETRLSTQMAGLVQTAERLDGEIAGIVVDERLLSASTEIEALEEGRARFRTAENDLPKRRLALAEQEAALSEALKALGQPGHTDPYALILPAALTARLRDLIEARSGILTRLRTAEREDERAQQALAACKDTTLGEEETEPNVQALRRLETLLARLQKGERQALLAMEQRAETQQAEQVARALDTLRPWMGSVEELERLECADARQIERWRTQADDLERRLSRHKERQRDIETRLAEIAARLRMIEQQGEPIDDGAAAEARALREAAWQAHVATLNGDTAQKFEETLRVDDRIGEARLSRASDLAELRQLQQDQGLQTALLARESELAKAAEAELATLGRSIGSAIPFATDEQPDIYRLLSGLENWSARRMQCLSLAVELDGRRQRRAALAEELASERRELELALADLGWTLGGGSDLNRLIQSASDRLSDALDQRARREAHEGRLADLTRESKARERDLSEARKADGLWQEAWTEALSATWFAEEREPSPVRAILDALSGLRAILRERDQMAQRIGLMERDMERFAADVERVSTLTGLSANASPLDLAEQMTRLKARAERDLLQKEAKEAERTALHQEIAGLKGRIAEHAARRQEMTRFFDVETLAEVSQRMEQAAERDRQEQRTRELAAQLLASVPGDDLETIKAELRQLDPEQMAGEAAELKARIEDLDQRSRQLFADLTRAKDRLAAVGGDDAVARLEAKRTTILMEIEDLAVRHLRLRAGTLAAERALSIYREKHRSSMMQRASEAFSQITRGDYSGLAALPDRDKEILIGVAKDGASKLSDAMSTGTRYQLYLALRLAGYEEFAAVRPAVPFVADDIMETFDELRSEEVFRLFGEMAKLGQVIYLTHHRHLCDIARQVVPGVKIHNL